MHERGTSTMSRIQINSYGATDTGRRRDHNEDRFFCDPELGIFMVIDGVGGYAAGEVAADIARDLIYRRLQLKTGTTEERLREAITAANNEIFAQSQTQPLQCGMACVLTVAVLEHGMVTVGHVGDTRLYEIRDGGIRKITRDHSLVGLMEDEGEISEEQAMQHPQRSEILRDVGSAQHDPDDEHFVDIYQFPFRSTSALLLCSDGLTDLVIRNQIEQTVREQAQQPEKTVQALIHQANEAGGVDNITVIVVFGEEFDREPNPTSTPMRPVIPEKRPSNRKSKNGVLKSRPAFFVYGLLAGYFFFVLPLLILFGVPDISLLNQSERIEIAEPRTLRVERIAGAAYQSITEALLEAKPGDVIEVAPGFYQERLVLRDSVSVVSSISGAAVIQSINGDNRDSVAVLARGVHDVHFKGFVIEPAGEGPLFVGIQLIDAGVFIEEVTIYRSTTSGISVEGDSDLLMFASVVSENSGTGITLKGSSRARLIQNIITGSNAAAVLIESEEIPILINNTLVHGSAGSIDGPALTLEQIEQLTEGNYVLVEQ